MNWVSYEQLILDTQQFALQLPQDTVGIVGIPRSGMLVASLVALARNLPLGELDAFCKSGSFFSSGSRYGVRTKPVGDTGTVIVLDDSIHCGRTMRTARRQLAGTGLVGRVIFACIYAEREVATRYVDRWHRVIEQPRLFEWNWLHHGLLAMAMLDFDGVLCEDPTVSEVENEEGYIRHLESAKPLLVPTVQVGWVVTTRLERWRSLSEAWLRAQRVVYGELVMLDGVSAARRRSEGLHADWKASHYTRTEALLFIESNPRQAERIATITGKPVLCPVVSRVYGPSEAVAPIPTPKG